MAEETLNTSGLVSDPAGFDPDAAMAAFILENEAIGSQLFGISADGKLAYFASQTNFTPFGTGASFPVNLSLSVTIENSVASLQLNGQPYPIKQVTGSVKKSFEVTSVGPGSLKDSGIEAMVQFVQRTQASFLDKKASNRMNLMEVQNNFINAFDILEVLPTSISGSKSGVATSNMSISFEDASNKKIALPITHMLASQEQRLIPLLNKLLEQMEGFNPRAYDNRTGDVSTDFGIRTDGPFIFVKEGFPEDPNGKYRALTEGLIAIIVDCYKRKLVDTGTFANRIAAQFGLYQDINNSQLASLRYRQIKEKADELQRLQEIEEQLNTMDITNPASRERLNELNAEQAKLKKEIADFESLATASINTIKDYLDLKTQGGDLYLNGAVYRYLTNPSILTAMSQVKEFQPLLKDVRGFMLKTQGAYSHMRLPVDPIYGYNDSLNPDFFWAYTPPDEAAIKNEITAGKEFLTGLSGQVDKLLNKRE